MSSNIPNNRKYLKVLKNAKKNVAEILKDCRWSFIEHVQNPTATKRIVGELDSPEWIAFTEKVFEKLKEKGYFYDTRRDIYDEFDDTAGGCDELTWNVGCELITEIQTTSSLRN